MTERGEAPLPFAFVGRRLVVERLGDRARVPDADRWTGWATTASVGAGRLGPRPCLAVDLGEDEETALPAGLHAEGLRSLHGRLGDDEFRVAARSVQLLDWLRTHRHCGRCGTATRLEPGENALGCPSCGQVHFPRIAPAVIVLVERDGEVLLGRSPHFPEGMYSTLAGFVEPGESAEEAVHREVREETGVAVEDLRWFGSQPWPFPHSLMLGFTARWAGGEVCPDSRELEDARWFAPDELPVLPSAMSIARRLIDDFLSRQSRATGR